MHVPEMTTYDWSVIIPYFHEFSCCNLITNCEFIIYVACSHVNFWCQKYSFQTHSTKTGARK